MSREVDNELYERIKQALNEIRPFLLEDGGDLELLDITDDLVARVELKGACKTCSMSSMTFKAGVEEAIRKVAPQIKRIEAII